MKNGTPVVLKDGRFGRVWQTHHNHYEFVYGADEMEGIPQPPPVTGHVPATAMACNYPLQSASANMTFPMITGATHPGIKKLYMTGRFTPRGNKQAGGFHISKVRRVLSERSFRKLQALDNL